MKNTINTAIAGASYQNLCASSIEPKHELAAIGIRKCVILLAEGHQAMAENQAL